MDASEKRFQLGVYRWRLTKSLSLLLLLCGVAPRIAYGQSPAPDPQLLSEIEKIRAIDNHAHPMRVVLPGEGPDLDQDALVSSYAPDFENYPPPVRLQPDYFENFEAWRALWGYRYRDLEPDHRKTLLVTKRAAVQEKGDGYASWVLDQMNIETMLANRIAMGRGLTPPRFRWVSFVDALLFPLNNDAEKAKNPDRKHFFEDEEALLKRYLKECGLGGLPDNLDDYLSKVVSATLQRQKQQGVVAVKFEVAYLRSVDFGDPTKAEASEVYARYRNGTPPANDYKKLQDYLFRYMAKEAGTLGLPVHMHILGGGAGTYYDSLGANPLLLTSVFTDPSLRSTKFVLVHGGEPWIKEVRMLFQKPNVYADFSAQTFLLSARELSQNIRAWLEVYPDRVLFGTDASQSNEEFGWEEEAWITNRTARVALAVALTGMMEDHEITREQALKLANMVLRDNASRLYHCFGSC
jgi:hypothetical protein